MGIISLVQQDRPARAAEGLSFCQLATGPNHEKQPSVCLVLDFFARQRDASNAIAGVASWQLEPSATDDYSGTPGQWLDFGLGSSQ